MSQIPLPDAVEELSYEAIRDAGLAFYADQSGVLVGDLDLNDPAVRVVEAFAYREMLLRQRINDATRQTMLASAFGQGLDDLGADPLYGETDRLEIDPGDPEAVPPIPPVYETDADYRARLRLAAQAYSTAGPEGAYDFHARSAHGEIVDVRVTSPDPCEILVEVLHDSADPDILTDVEDALSYATVRPLGDRVTVEAAVKEASTLDLTVWVGDGPELAAVEAASQAKVDELIQPIAARVGSGAVLSLNGSDLWKGAAMVPGVQTVEETASTGLSNTSAAWWPLTITITAQRIGT